MDKVEKGKRLFLIMAIIIVLFDLLVIFFTYTPDDKSIATGVIRLVIEVSLLRAIYNGSNVARVIQLIFLSLAVMGCFFVIVILSNAILNLFAISIMGLYSWMIYVLSGSPSFKAYFSSMR